MAKSAEPRALQDLGALLAPFPGRFSMAWRLALLCALSTVVSMTYQIPEAAIGCYLIFFVMKADAAESAILAIALSILVSLVVGVLLTLTILTIETPSLRFIALAASSLGMLYLGSASMLGPIGGIIALVIAYGMTLLSDVPFGEVATRALLYAWLMASVPMGLTLLLSLVIGRQPQTLLRATLRERVDAAADLVAPDSSNAARLHVRELIDDGQIEHKKRLKMTAGLRLVTRQQAIELSVALEQTYRLLLAVEVLSSETPVAARHALVEQMRAVAQALGAGKPVPAPPDLKTIESAPNGALREVWQALVSLSQVPHAAPPDGPASSFFKADARTNPNHLRYALKTTAAALFCYLIYTALDWQDIHTAMITCYVAALGSVAETTQKLLLRLIGCLIGAAMGVAVILFAIPLMTSIGSLAVLIFLGTFVAAWVACGSERVSYAGVQIALAFLLTVLQGFGPSIDMSVALDRVLGVLLGNVVLYVVFTQIWPVSVANTVRENLAQACSGLARLARLPHSARAQALVEASVVSQALADTQRALELSALEPRYMRLDAKQAHRLAAILQIARSLCPRMYVLATPDERRARRMQTLAQEIRTHEAHETVQHAAGSSEQGGVRDRPDIQGNGVDRRIAKMESLVGSR